MKTFSLLFLSVFVLLSAVPAQAQNHFTNCTQRTGSNATIIIPSDIYTDIGGRSIEVGDEIAVFSEDGTCAGVVVWTGVNVALTAWGVDPFLGEGQGFGVGDPLHFRVWSAASDREYGTTDSIVVGFSSDRPYYNHSGLYTPDAIYVLKTLEVKPAGKGGIHDDAHSDFETGRAREIPAVIELQRNYPNPFRSTTTIAYSLARDEYVTVDVIDTQGRSVGVLLAAHQPAGSYEITFDGSNLPSGLYLCRLAAESFTTVHRMTLIR